ncbi:chemotaxis protein CheW [Aliikangiella coralliicola]|uniref:CheW-like domain-containing protein n=1 Tax=Aliikangiella coralliicola TaxID=2592383 RepID=A0A545UB46_9GAMM|nr:chemotaxis protein CheW [Aliikangiella coralliicola]TQV86688.1 hypothetical protein FLL46_17495 [Aliikangiella coralliicola]
MKLNKPPVSEQQSALEEYVDFLLTDLSNVTHISTKKNERKKHAHKREGKSEFSTTETPSARSHENTNTENLKTDNFQTENFQSESFQTEEIEKPKWTTIEKVVENTSNRTVQKSEIEPLAPEDSNVISNDFEQDIDIEPETENKNEVGQEPNEKPRQDSKKIESEAVNFDDKLVENMLTVAEEKQRDQHSTELEKKDNSETLSAQEVFDSFLPEEGLKNTDELKDTGELENVEETTNAEEVQVDVQKFEQHESTPDVLETEGLETESSETEVDVQTVPGISHSFTEESEEEEAKKWDALLTKEKEQQLLAEEIRQSQSEIVGAKTSDIEVPETDAKSENVEQLETEVAEDIKQENVAEGFKNISDVINREKELSDSTSRQTEKIVDDFLPHKDSDPRLAGVEKLLAKISLATKPVTQVKTTTEAKTTTESKTQTTQVAVSETDVESQSTQATFLHREAKKTKDVLPEVFQTLIFQVKRLPLAVPLLKLGGIVKVSEEDITPLVGTPDWFIGLTPNDRGNLMVVDTQKYLMPEQSVADSDEFNYEYLIILDDSNWALACHSVGDAKNLTVDDIRWSERSSKRPWFAGMVVDYMSALIEVDELINMLADNIVE